MHSKIDFTTRHTEIFGDSRDMSTTKRNYIEMLTQYRGTFALRKQIELYSYTDEELRLMELKVIKTLVPRLHAFGRRHRSPKVPTPLEPTQGRQLEIEAEPGT